MKRILARADVQNLTTVKTLFLLWEKFNLTGGNVVTCVPINFATSQETLVYEDMKTY